MKELLMSIIKKYSPKLNLSNFQTFITDDLVDSKYFRITELNETLTGGKNGFLIEGTEYLRESTELKIEVLDVEGNPVYFEPGYGIPEYYEGNSTLISIHIYNDTPIGIGSITILGELKTYEDEYGANIPVPVEWRDVYNVKWTRFIKINKLLSNEDKVRFYMQPTVEITEVVKPIYVKTIPSNTQTGSVSGTAEFPPVNTDLRNWSAGATYKLSITDVSNWSSSMDSNTISIDVDGTAYTTTIKEILNSKDILVDIPYTNNNLVADFNSQPYTITYNDIDSQTIDTSALTGSFAEIKFAKLKTFVGDIARVKVYRKSQTDIGDYQFTQDTKLESTELLRDLTNNLDTVFSFGNFTEYNLNNYWDTSSLDHPVSINDTILYNSLKIDYNTSSGSSQSIITNSPISITKDVEYTLSFKTLLSGSIDSTKNIRAYLSSSTFSQEFVEVNSSNETVYRTNISQNIIATATADAYLVFEITGDDWYISNVSLRNAQETSFSPDEFSLVQDIPRKLPQETFDFKFEFYDINNNYIPVDVITTKEFTGGNSSESSTLTKFLQFDSTTTAFRFITGSIGNPVNQQIGLTITKNLLTGSVLYESGAYDMSGTYIDPSTYTGQYPGFLTNMSDNGATLTIGNFTGSNASVLVGSIIYTASLEDKIEYETIYRFEDGDSASDLLVSANTHQLIFEPTNLNLAPNTQNIKIQVKRKNLSSPSATITANSSSGAPGLSEISDINGVKIYQLTGTDVSYLSGELKYEFTGSDQFSNSFSDEIIITPILNYSAVTVTLSNNGTAIKADSSGSVTTADLDLGDGTVAMHIGTSSIAFESGLSNTNRFDIISVTGTNCTPNSTAPTTNTYGISAMSSNTASLNLLIRYKAGDSSTFDFTKIVNYSKALSAAPNVLITADLQSQTVTGDLELSTFGTPQDITITVSELGTDYTYTTGTVTSNKFKIVAVTNATNNNDGSITPDTPTLSTGLAGTITISYTDSDNNVVTGKIVNFNIGVAIAGINAKAVKLTAPNYVIAYDLNGVNPTPSGSINLTATAQNVSTPYYKFTGDTISNDSDYGSYNPKTYTIPTSYALFGTSDTIQVSLSETSGSGTEVATDSITISAIKPGTDGADGVNGISNEFYYIKPLSGTQIKNHTGSLELQAVYVSGSVSSNLTSGSVQLYDNGTLLSVITGVTDGGGGVTYNPVFSSSGINGTKTISLQNGSAILDTITLLDVIDGIAGGTIVSSNLKTNRINTGTVANPVWSYSPATLTATGSFYGSDGVNYTSSLALTASYVSNLDEFEYNLGFTHPSMSVVINNGAGIDLVEGITTATKDVHITYTFIDPLLEDSYTAQETFYIISDGQDGYDAITAVLTNDSHTITADSTGNNENFVGSGTDIYVYEGATALSYDGVGTSNSTWKIIATKTNVTGSIVDSGTYATLNDLTAMNSDAGSILYEISGSRSDGTLFNTAKTQTFSKSKKAVPNIIINATPASQTVTANSSGTQTGTLSNISITALEGTTDRFTSMVISGTPTGFSTPPTVSTNTLVMSSAVMNATEGSVVIQVSYTDSEGTAGTQNITIHTTKVNYGVDGATSQYVVVTGEQAFKYLTGASTPTVSNITLTAALYGSLSSYDWEYWNGASWTNLSGTNTNSTYTLAYNNAAWSSDSLRVRCLSGAYFDEITIIKLYDGIIGPDGVAAINGYLTNEVVAVPSATDGTGYSLTSAGGTFEVFSGTTDVTTSSTFSGTATQNGLTFTIDSSTGVYTLSGGAWTSDSESFSVTATYNSVVLTKVYTISKAKAGTDAKAIVLSAVSNIFKKAKDGTITPTSIDFTANTQNTTGVVSFASSPTVTLSGTGNTRTLTSANFGSNNLVTITATVDSISDSQTVILAEEGSDAINAVLSNEAHIFKADATGSITDFTGGGTTIQVYEGTSLLTYTTATAAAGEYTISKTNTNLTIATITGNGLTTATVPDPTAMTADFATASYEISGKRNNGTVFTTTKIQSFSKSTAGDDGIGTRYVYQLNNSATAPTTPTGNSYPPTSWTTTTPSVTSSNKYGWVSQQVSDVTGAWGSWQTPSLWSNFATDGAAGTDAQVVSLTGTKYTVPYTSAGALSDATAITFTADSQNVTSAQYQFLKNGTEVQAFSTTATYTYTPTTSVPGPTNVDLIKVNVRSGTGATVAYDTVDVYGIQDATDGATGASGADGSNGTDGADGFTVFLTNEAHAFSAPNTGYSGVDYTNSDFEIRVYKGTTQYTYDGTTTYAADSYRIGTVTATGIVTTQSGADGTQRVFTQSAITADQGTVAVDIIDNASSTTFTRTFTFSVSHKGDTGNEGAGIEYAYYSGSVIPTTTPYAAGWSTTPNGVDLTNQYEWIKQRTSTNGVYGSWSTPATLFSKYGLDGKSVEYVYKLTTTNSQPATPTTVQTDGNIPAGWTDNPTGVDATNLYEWITTRSKTSSTGLWTNWSAPAVFSKYGETGATGAAGANATKSTTGYVYYQTAQASAPGTPTATSYTFTTYTFTGLTSGWSKTPPAATGGGQYWMSVYNVTETSTGFDTGTPTFTTPNNSLQFTDIATFTNLANPNDASTVIDGSNITTGIIKSANYTTGTAPYSSAGTLIDLSSGAITGSNFSIDASGNVNLNGSISFTNSPLISTFNNDLNLSDNTVANQATASAATAQGAADSVTADLQDVIDGVPVGGTFIDGNNVYSPNIAGNSGNISGALTIGNTGHIKGGRTNYNTGIGFFLGYDTGSLFDYVFSIGEAGGDEMLWDGNGLSISGTIAAGNGNIGGWNIASNKLYSGTNNGTDGGYSTNDGITLGSTGWLSSRNFYISSSGEATFKGTLSGATGNFGGSLTAATGTFSGSVTADSGNIGGWDISASTLSSGNLTLDATRPSLSILSGSVIRVDISDSDTLTDPSSGSAPGVTPTTVTTSTQDSESTAGDQFLTTTQSPVSASYTTANPIMSASVDDIGNVVTIAINLYQGSAVGYINSYETAAVESVRSHQASANIGVTITGPSFIKHITKYISFVDTSTSHILYNTAGHADGDIVGSFTIPAAGNYTITPIIRDGTSRMDLAASDVFTLWTKYNTPLINSVTTSVSRSKTEIVAGGFQVMNSSTSYFLADRAVSDSISTPWLISHGFWTHYGTFTDSSDRNIKDNIIPLNFKLKDLQKIGSYSFDKYSDFSKTKGKQHTFGIIAQELEKVIPSAVTTIKKTGIKVVDYKAVTALLLSSVKQLNDKMEKMSEEIAELKKMQK